MLRVLTYHLVLPSNPVNPLWFPPWDAALGGRAARRFPVGGAWRGRPSPVQGGGGVGAKVRLSAVTAKFSARFFSPTRRGAGGLCQIT